MVRKRRSGSLGSAVRRGDSPFWAPKANIVSEHLLQEVTDLVTIYPSQVVVLGRDRGLGNQVREAISDNLMPGVFQEAIPSFDKRKDMILEALQLPPLGVERARMGFLEFYSRERHDLNRKDLVHVELLLTGSIYIGPPLPEWWDKKGSSRRVNGAIVDLVFGGGYPTEAPCVSVFSNKRLSSEDREQNVVLMESWWANWTVEADKSVFDLIGIVEAMLSLPENIEMAPSSPELPVSTAPRCDTALSAKAAAIQADVDICWVHSSVESEEDIRSEEESDTGESKLRLVDFLRLDTTEPPVATLGSRPNSRRNSVQLTTQLSLPPTNDFAGLSKVLLLDDQFENCSELRRAPFGLLLEATNKVDQKRYLLDVVCLGDLSETVANALLESSMRLAALSNAFVSRYFNSWITVCSTNDRLLEVTAGYPNKRSVSVMPEGDAVWAAYVAHRLVQIPQQMALISQYESQPACITLKQAVESRMFVGDYISILSAVDQIASAIKAMHSCKKSFLGLTAETVYVQRVDGAVRLAVLDQSHTRDVTLAVYRELGAVDHVDFAASLVPDSSDYKEILTAKWVEQLARDVFPARFLDACLVPTSMLPYLPAEYLDEEAWTEKMDIWALGVILVELLAGPFESEVDRVFTLLQAAHRRVIPFANTMEPLTLELLMLAFDSNPALRPTCNGLQSFAVPVPEQEHMEVFVARVGSAKLPYISYCIQKLFSGNQTKVPVSCTRPSLDFSHSFLETCVMHRVRKLLLKHGYQYVPLPELWPFRSRSLLPFVESRWLTEKGGVLCSYRTPLIPLMQLDLPRVGSCRLSERGVVRAALVLRRKDGCASRLECLEGIFPFLSDLLGIYQDWSLTVCFPKLAVHLMHQLFAVGIRLPGLAAHLCSLIHEISHARTRRRHDRLVYALQVFHLILQMSNKAEPFLPHRETLSDYALKWLGSGGQLSPRALLSSFVDLGLPIFVTCGDLTLENLATSSLRWSKAVIELNSGAQGAVAKTVDAVKDAISVLGLPSFKIHCRLLTPEALLDPRVNVESCSMYCAVHSGDTVVCAGGQLAPSFSAEVAEVGPETTDWPYRPQNRTFTTVDEVAFFLDFILDARSTRLAEDHSLQKLWSPYCVVLSQHEDLLPLAFELLHKLRSSGIRVAQLPAPCFDISFVRQSLRSAGVNLMAVVMRKKREEDLQFRIESLISQEEAVYSTSVEMAVMDVLRRLKGERAERLSEVEV